jgi:hypothetical protein
VLQSQSFEEEKTIRRQNSVGPKDLPRCVACKKDLGQGTRIFTKNVLSNFTFKNMRYF